jgi:hypothetical protein
MILITVNALLLIIFIAISLILLNLYSKTMFGDISKIIFINIIIAPPVFSIANLITLYLFYPSMLLWGASPIAITILYLFSTYVDTYIKSKRIKKLNNFKLILIKKATEKDLHLSKEHIRFRLRPNKTVDIIVNVYNSEHRTDLEKLFLEIEKNIDKESVLNPFKINFYIDEKKSSNITKIA